MRLYFFKPKKAVDNSHKHKVGHKKTEFLSVSIKKMLKMRHNLFLPIDPERFGAHYTEK